MSSNYRYPHWVTEFHLLSAYDGEASILVRWLSLQ
jgi:hypothetical protein